MKTIYKILLPTLFFVLLITKSYSEDNRGDASSYKVVMTYLELCENGSSATECKNPVVIGSGDSGDINIADTVAGAAAATFGNLNKGEIGKTYTWMQVTLKRAMKITGTVSDGTNTCITNGTDDGTISTAQEGKTSGAAAETVLYAGLTTSNMGDYMNSVSAGDGTGTSQDAGTVDNDDEYFEYRMDIPDLTLTAGKIPTTKLAFGTSNALGYAGTTGGCTSAEGETQGLFAAEPQIEVTFQ